MCLIYQALPERWSSFMHTHISTGQSLLWQLKFWDLCFLLWIQVSPLRFELETSRNVMSLTPLNQLHNKTKVLGILRVYTKRFWFFWPKYPLNESSMIKLRKISHRKFKHWFIHAILNYHFHEIQFSLLRGWNLVGVILWVSNSLINDWLFNYNHLYYIECSKLKKHDSFIKYLKNYIKLKTKFFHPIRY